MQYAMMHPPRLLRPVAKRRAPMGGKGIGMAEIIEFPSEQVRTWTDWERIYRQALARASASSDMIETVVSRMKLHHQIVLRMTRVPFAITVPPLIDPADVTTVDKSLDGALRNLEVHVHRVINDLLIQLFKLEMEVYYLQSRPKGN